jgi:hypothetical protein
MTPNTYPGNGGGGGFGYMGSDDDAREPIPQEIMKKYIT